jgi:hypothetical protein
MGILGKDKLLELIENYKCVYPFDLNLLDGDSYVLTVRDETTLQYLEHRNLISNDRTRSSLRPRIMWHTSPLKASTAEWACRS